VESLRTYGSYYGWILLATGFDFFALAIGFQVDVDISSDRITAGGALHWSQHAQTKTVDGHWLLTSWDLILVANVDLAFC